MCWLSAALIVVSSPPSIRAPVPCHPLSAQDGHTPLHYATQNGHLKVVAALLEKGVDKEAKDNVRIEGRAPPSLASIKQAHPSVPLLLSRGRGPADDSSRKSSVDYVPKISPP